MKRGMCWNGATNGREDTLEGGKLQGMQMECTSQEFELLMIWRRTLWEHFLQ